jgi:hypothetical protein
MNTIIGVLIYAVVAGAPAFAGQRGHGAQTPHPATPAVPATRATPATPATPPTHATPAAPATPETHAKAATPAASKPVNISQRIETNPALAARLQPLVPSGLTLTAAATGFRTQGQFIAALHVSRNLNIPFIQLKNAMTGADHISLGQAIHDLRPKANANAAVKAATAQARADLRAK